MGNTTWLEHQYAARLNEERELEGTDRCKSAGSRNVRDLRDLVVDGFARSPETGGRLTTAALRTNGVWIFAVKNGRMRLGPDGGSRRREGEGAPFAVDAIKHETLFHNQPVSAAGEVRIWRGVVVDLNKSSGTYLFSFDTSFRGAVREAILDAGAKIGVALERKLL